MANGNMQYRSDVFSMLLQDKKRALEIYNAVNGTAYDDPEQVEITTLEGTSFSLTIRNDASFVLDADFSLYEHQSTLCPNMMTRPGRTTQAQAIIPVQVILSARFTDIVPRTRPTTGLSDPPSTLKPEWITK